MKKFKLYILWAFIILIFPINILAYSEYIIPGGENIGIHVNSKGVLIVGFYKVDDRFIARENGFQVGDIITNINDEEVFDISSMASKINSSNNIKFTLLRNNKKINIIVNNLKNIDGIYKTGLYVKDKIVGIGTLTYIDPGTKIFGALGHEIDERTTLQKFEIKDGNIFKSNVVSIDRSENGKAGEKNASYDENTIYGNIKENTDAGIFGEYFETFPDTKKLKVANIDEIKTGPAIIRTVINNDTIEEFDINIIKIDKNNGTKNMLFEITDDTLIEKTGGIVQGMSGSPIIQNNMIIGAVTHVIVNDTVKGYAIFITTMLEEGEN